MAGCRRLLFRSPPDEDTIRRQTLKVAESLERGVIKIIVTRGRGGRGYRVSPTSVATWAVGSYAWPVFDKRCQNDGASVLICRTRLGHQPALAGVKHLNRLEQVLARCEWQHEWDEGLMLDQEGTLVEGTMCNVFLVEDGRLFTPLLDRAGVAGIMREQVLRLSAHLGLDASERRIPMSDLDRAEEIFLTNSLIGVWPIRRVNRRHLQPGPVSRRLQRAIHDEDLVVTE